MTIRCLAGSSKVAVAPTSGRTSDTPLSFNSADSCPVAGALGQAGYLEVGSSMVSS